MTTGERIKAERKEKKITQQMLADLIGVKKQTVYKYENDIITNIPSEKLEMIADILKVSPTYLMGWTNEALYEEFTQNDSMYQSLIGTLKQIYGEKQVNAFFKLVRLDDEDLGRIDERMLILLENEKYKKTKMQIETVHETKIN